jgi:hypothetical protein
VRRWNRIGCYDSYHYVTKKEVCCVLVPLGKALEACSAWSIQRLRLHGAGPFNTQRCQGLETLRLRVENRHAQ